MYEKYLVNSNDTLQSIAKKFNVLETTILDINNIPYPDMIRNGLEIIVPKNEKEYFKYYTIKDGDTLYQIGKKNNINPELLAALNGLNLDDYIYSGQKIMIPQPNYSFYITKDGDTLSLVSEKFNTSEKQLISQNQTIYLMPGQLIISKR